MRYKEEKVRENEVREERMQNQETKEDAKIVWNTSLMKKSAIQIAKAGEGKNTANILMKLEMQNNNSNDNMIM